MTLEQVDTLISEWQARIASATENLLALDDTSTMKRIEGRDGLAPLMLTGVTAARVLPAVAAMRELFNQLGTLSDVVDRAARLRRSLNRLWKYDETLNEIQRLLTGPSIPLPSLPTPLAKRSLVTASEDKRAISPDRLLTVMIDAFETARDAVLAVDTAWERLTLALDATRTKAEALRQQAEALGLSTPVALDELTTRMAALRSRILSDPLSVEQEVEGQFAPLLSAARQTIEQQGRQREGLRDHLRQARHQLDEICKIHTTVETVFLACRERLGGEAGLHPPQPETAVQELERWLTSLEALMRSEQWPSISVGLERWQQAATFLQTTEQTALTANEALLEVPAELKGRLSALRVRARAQGINDPAFDRLVLQADTLLQGSSVPLDRLTKLIASCEARLRR